jgi:hypothetical protein
MEGKVVGYVSGVKSEEGASKFDGELYAIYLLGY